MLFPQEILKLEKSINDKKAANAELTLQRDSLRDSLETDRKRLHQLESDITEASVTKRRVSSIRVLCHNVPLLTKLSSFRLLLLLPVNKSGGNSMINSRMVLIAGSTDWKR